jgi:hypothetical protein
MAKVYESIEGRLRAFIEAQPVFFVATAPSGPDGHVNISPKGTLGTFAVLDGHRVAYLDYTGSGIETVAHLRENARITIMFCAFSGPPTIVRLHGRGVFVRPGESRFDELLGAFADVEKHALRSVIEVQVDRVSDSCGYSVPFLDYVGERTVLAQVNGRKTDADLEAYHRERNAASIDGLPGLA